MQCSVCFLCSLLPLISDGFHSLPLHSKAYHSVGFLTILEIFMTSCRRIAWCSRKKERQSKGVITFWPVQKRSGIFGLVWLSLRKYIFPEHTVRCSVPCMLQQNRTKPYTLEWWRFDTVLIMIQSVTKQSNSEKRINDQV